MYWELVLVICVLQMWCTIYWELVLVIWFSVLYFVTAYQTNKMWDNNLC